MDHSVTSISAMPVTLARLNPNRIARGNDLR
jgi:hypothetical protein